MAHRVKFLLQLCVVALLISFLLLYATIESSNEDVARFVKEANRQAKRNTPISPFTKSRSSEIARKRIEPNKKPKVEIVLVIVACGDRLNDTSVVLKSAIALTKVPFRIIVICDDDLRPQIQYQLSLFPPNVLQRIHISLVPLSFPNDGHTEEWKKLFKPCASQRLFLPSLLQNEDAIIYVDTDVIFLRPLDHLWDFFEKMNSSQLAAMTPEHQDFAVGWYNRFAQHPYYGPLGVNSGVMLMNLTRMREFNWESYLAPIYLKYKLNIVWGDQDILNILFHDHPDKLYIYPCEWNYRPDHCMYSSVCKTAEFDGAAVVHGSRGVFHNDKQPAFKALYDAMLSYPIGRDSRKFFLMPLKAALKGTMDTNCGKVHHLFIKPLEKYLPLNTLRKE